MYNFMNMINLDMYTCNTNYKMASYRLVRASKRPSICYLLIKKYVHNKMTQLITLLQIISDLKWALELLEKKKPLRE